MYPHWFSRLEPRLDRQPVVKKNDRPSDLRNPEGECRLLIVLLNPGSGPSCEIERFPAWVESPLASPTCRTVADLVHGCARAPNWEHDDYARIVCLFQNTGKKPEDAFTNIQCPDIEKEAQRLGNAPVVFGWGSAFKPDPKRYKSHDIAAFREAKKQYIKQFPDAVWARWVRPQFVSVAPSDFNDGIIPAHPRAAHGGWPNAILEALNKLAVHKLLRSLPFA